MSTREQIIKTAYSWVDTPYHHHAMVHGAGVDCAMLVVACAIGAELFTAEQASTIVKYPVHWHLHNREEKLLEQLESYGCVRIDKALTQPGDIVTFQYGRTTSHLGIMVTQTEFVHARVDFKKVVVNTMNEEFEKRWTYTYMFPGVDNV